MSTTFPACRELISLVILQGLDWAGAELFLELLLDLRLKELWDRDVGRSAAIAAIVSIATGQNHSWFAWQPGSPWITTG